MKLRRCFAVCCTFALAAGGAWAAASDNGHGCLIEPWQRIDLRSPVEGAIAAIHVDRGSAVRRGQLLFELDTATERAALDAARYRSVMEGPLKSAQHRVEAAREKFQRRDELSKEQFIARQDRDDAAAELKAAEAALVEAQDNRRLAELEHRRLAEAVEQRRIKSPVNGIVTERLQQAGEVAQTGESARPVLRLAQIHPLRVEVVLPLTMLGKLKAGSKAEVALEPPLKGSYPATVTIVDRVVDSASGTFGVRMELPNPAGDLSAGVKCRVRFPG